MTQNQNLAALSAAGVSVWLDDLSRDRLQTGNLQELIDTKSVVGVTTNPSIFQSALSSGDAYDEQINELAARGADVEATIRTITTDDVRNACDVLAKQYEQSDGVDGRVSIEVDPRMAHDTDKTILQAIDLWKTVDRPNLLIKIPATMAGIPAITAVLAEGISVNVTLIFSVERHRMVMDAYLAGLEKAKEAGHDIRVGRFPFAANGKAIALGEDQGLIKTIFDKKTGQLLGAHMVGAEVTELIQGFVVAMNLETTEEELMHTIFPHPTLSEMMKESVLDAYGRVLNA